MHLCAKAQGCSRCIHRHISAADNRNLLTLHDRRVGVFVKRLHQIASGQIFVRGEYTIRILPGDSHEFRQSGTGTDKYGIKALLADQLINGDRFTDDNVRLDFHAQCLYIFNFPGNNRLLGKTELRYSIDQNAARLMKRLKNRHIISKLRQISGTGQTRRAGTDDSNLLSVLLLRAFGLDSVLSRPVSNESLKLSDRDRIALDATDTLTLTLALLRTDTSADSGKCAGLADDPVCLLDISILHLLDEARNIDGNGTALDTLCILTVDTSGGFTHRLLFIIAKTNLLEVCCTLFRILLSHRDSCQHVHIISPCLSVACRLLVAGTIYYTNRYRNQPSHCPQFP